MPNEVVTRSSTRSSISISMVASYINGASGVHRIGAGMATRMTLSITGDSRVIRLPSGASITIRKWVGSVGLAGRDGAGRVSWNSASDSSILGVILTLPMWSAARGSRKAVCQIPLVRAYQSICFPPGRALWSFGSYTLTVISACSLVTQASVISNSNGV